MRIAIVHPGTQWSTADVYEGLCYGLEAQGVEVVRTTAADAVNVSGAVDLIVLVTAIRLKVPFAELLCPAVALFTESPYEAVSELTVASLVSGCWTHERTAVEAFKSVNPNSAYLQHAWHPAVHTPEPKLSDAVLPAHDVVFVGSGFRERVSFFNSIDWTGIDLGLYGIWADLGLKDQVQACVRSDGPISNEMAAGLYRRAKIGLNLYRRLPSQLVRDVPENWVKAESLNPRAYELAACGCFQLSEKRKESEEMFSESAEDRYSVEEVWHFQRSDEAQESIRCWLAADAPRIDVGALARVARHSWAERGAQVLSDLHAWGLVEKPCLTVQ